MTDQAGGAGMTSDELGTRLFEACLGAFDVFSVYLGDRLGYYRALAAVDSVTSDQLAQATDTAERYAREWLEQQAMTGFLLVEDTGSAPSERRYQLPPAHAEVFTDRDSLGYLAPAAVATAAAGVQLPAVADAFRNGGGVSWSVFGNDMRDAQGEMNRPLLLHVLGHEWLPQIPDVHRRLSSAGARVADIGSGQGWSAIGIASAYADATVDGYDVDEPSIATARRHAEEHHVTDRVSFHVADASRTTAAGYDLVIAVECIHDMPDPVAVLAQMREMVADDGVVLVVDERTADAFQPSGDPMERLLYGFSVTTCLPDGLSTDASVGTGTVMRRGTLHAYATEAGFEDVEVLPIEHDQFRIYRLVR